MGDLAQTVEQLQAEVTRLLKAIRTHWEQRAEDRCFLDDIELYTAAGLEPADVRVGDKLAMLENCKRFLERRCEGGRPWTSYEELQAERDALRAIAVFARSRFCDPTAIERDPAAVRLKQMCDAILEAPVRELDGGKDADSFKHNPGGGRA